jgi:hypothetical protein
MIKEQRVPASLKLLSTQPQKKERGLSSAAQIRKKEENVDGRRLRLRSAPKATMEKGATREGAITAAHRSHNGRLIA